MRPAWELMSLYHLAKAAEVLGTFTTQGSMEGHFDIREQTEDDQRVLRNPPARVYYGVNSDEAVALRLLGVPRAAAVLLTGALRIEGTDSLTEVFTKLYASKVDSWKAALGDRGEGFLRVWTIIEGHDVGDMPQ